MANRAIYRQRISLANLRENRSLIYDFFSMFELNHTRLHQLQKVVGAASNKQR